MEILDLLECSRDVMEKAGMEAEAQFRSAVRPIYGSTEYGRPFHIGSCFLFERDDTKFLVTAAHIIDDNEVTTLYVAGESALVAIVGHSRVSIAPNEWRSLDKVDVAIVKLAEDVLSQLGGVRFIRESECILHELSGKARHNCVLGYPNAINKRYDAVGSKVELGPYQYTSVFIFDPKRKVQTETFAEAHYLIDCDPKWAKDPEGMRIRAIEPKGISGGGVFLLVGLATPEAQYDSWKCSSKLVGMVIEFRRAFKVLVALRISVIVQIIESSVWHDLPELKINYREE